MGERIANMVEQLLRDGMPNNVVGRLFLDREPRGDYIIVRLSAVEYGGNLQTDISSTATASVEITCWATSIANAWALERQTSRILRASSLISMRTNQAEVSALDEARTFYGVETSWRISQQ